MYKQANKNNTDLEMPLLYSSDLSIVNGSGWLIYIIPIPEFIPLTKREQNTRKQCRPSHKDALWGSTEGGWQKLTAMLMKTGRAGAKAAKDWGSHV